MKLLLLVALVSASVLAEPEAEAQSTVDFEIAGGYGYNLVLDKELQIESLIENLPDGRNVAIEEPYAKGSEPMEAAAPVAPAAPAAPAAPVPVAPKPVAAAAPVYQAAPGYGVAEAPVLAGPAPVVTGPASEVNFNIGPHGYRYLLAHGTAPALAPPVPKAAPVVVAPVAPAASIVPGALGTPIALPNGYLQKLLELNAQAIAEAKPIAPAAAAALLSAAYAPVPIPTAYTPVPAAYTSVPAADTPVPAATAPVPAYAPAPAAYAPVPAAYAPVPAVEPVSGVGPAVPQVHVVGPVDPNLPYNVVPHPLNPLYNGAPAVHYLGKRSAEAAPEATPEAWGKNPAVTWYGAPYDPLAGHLWLGQNPYLFHGPRYVYGAGYPLV